MKEQLARYNFKLQERERTTDKSPKNQRNNTYVKFDEKKPEHSNQNAWIIKDPKVAKDIETEWNILGKIIRKGRDGEKPKKFLLTCLFAGHGMIDENL